MSLVDDINNLDPQNMGGWPLPFKLGLVVIVFSAIVAAGWHYDWKGQWQALEKVEKEEQVKISELEVKQKKAANLAALKEQMQEMEQSFGDMLRQLPNKTEVAGLLVDISQTGLGAGLEFELFKPSPEKPTEFYAELPIEIKVRGEYHQLGEFVSGVAALPRIVTTHDIDITRIKDSESGALVMTAIAKTYRALDEEEEQEEEEPKKGKKAKKKKGKAK